MVKLKKHGMLLTVVLFGALTGAIHASEEVTQFEIKVKDGVVQPKRSVEEAVEDAMHFLKLADGAYVPGDISGELAGYFTSAHVNTDGSRTGRQLAFPGRQHAYFINTFLLYRDHTGDDSWLQRARDLADWNLVHTTPSSAVYANLPYSVWEKGKGGGSADKDSTEPDKAAFIGSSYLALYEITKDERYLNGAKSIAETLIKTQREDGSWPFRVIPEDGRVFHDIGGAPVFYVQFFEDLLKLGENEAYQRAHDQALALMIDRNVKRNEWGIYHEDIRSRPDSHLSAEVMSFTASYLLGRVDRNPEYLEMGKLIIQRMEDRLVHTEGHPAAPAPAVSEQVGFEHMMPGHTARYCKALVDLYLVTKDEAVKKKAQSGINALTWMQTDEGLFATHFKLVKEKNPKRKRPNWYSQHLYTVCHVLEIEQALPEMVN